MVKEDTEEALAHLQTREGVLTEFGQRTPIAFVRARLDGETYGLRRDFATSARAAATLQEIHPTPNPGLRIVIVVDVQ